VLTTTALSICFCIHVHYAAKQAAADEKKIVSQLWFSLNISGAETWTTANHPPCFKGDDALTASFIISNRPEASPLLSFAVRFGPLQQQLARCNGSLWC
jgi:hypothetical protein